jgi:hypothetical protein
MSEEERDLKKSIDPITAINTAATVVGAGAAVYSAYIAHKDSVSKKSPIC